MSVVLLPAYYNDPEHLPSGFMPALLAYRCRCCLPCLTFSLRKPTIPEVRSTVEYICIACWALISWVLRGRSPITLERVTVSCLPGAFHHQFTSARP